MDVTSTTKSGMVILVPSGWYTTIEEARMALQEMEMDVRMDMGEDAVEAGWRDIVYACADLCSPEVARELLYNNGFGDNFTG